MPPEKPCFDQNEIEGLAATLRRLLYAPSELRKELQKLGVNVIPANFYSSVPLIEDLQRFPDPGYNRIFNKQTMVRGLTDLAKHAADFDAPMTADENEPIYRWKCDFSYSDAPSYHAFIRKLRPRTVLAVGSGYSTLIARKAFDGKIVCIDADPRPFLKSLPDVAVIDKPVQAIDPEFFNDTLSAGDILFINSTHTVKQGSDCLHLYLSVLPEIRRDITVHVHDIHLPEQMPLYYGRDHQIYWTEQYLLYAYLLENPRAKVIFSSTWHYLHNRERLETFMRGRYPAGGGSIWFSHKAR